MIFFIKEYISSHKHIYIIINSKKIQYHICTHICTLHIKHIRHNQYMLSSKNIIYKQHNYNSYHATYFHSC